jgi:cysteine-rich repeat protein
MGYACTGSPSACLPVCGDGIRVVPESCDDGNLSEGDGCSSVCENEYAAASSFAVSSVAALPILPPPMCGNGLIEGSEQCDDGNLFDTDGCSHLCTFELLPLSSISAAPPLQPSSPYRSSDSFSAPILMPAAPVPSSSGGSFWILAFGLFILIIVALVITLLRRKKEEE